MKGISGLTSAIKSAVQKKVAEESRAKRGTIQNGQFVSGNKSYPVKQAVDVNASNGSKIWAQLDNNGNAVIVGS